MTVVVPSPPSLVFQACSCLILQQDTGSPVIQARLAPRCRRSVPLRADRALGEGIETRAEVPSHIQSTARDTVELKPGLRGRLQSHGAAAGAQSEFAGSRTDILQDILQDIPQDAGYLAGYLKQDILSRYPERISCRISSEPML